MSLAGEPPGAMSVDGAEATGRGSLGFHVSVRGGLGLKLGVPCLGAAGARGFSQVHVGGGRGIP